MTTFNRGDLVEVSDSGKNWNKRIFLTKIEGLEGTYICVTQGDEYFFVNEKTFRASFWKHIRPLQKKKIKLTLQEIATKYGVDEVEIIN